MSNSGNETDDQISYECPIVEALSMVSLEEPSSTIGESMEEEIFPISMESEVAESLILPPLWIKLWKGPPLIPLLPIWMF